MQLVRGNNISIYMATIADTVFVAMRRLRLLLFWVAIDHDQPHEILH